MCVAEHDAIPIVQHDGRTAGHSQRIVVLAVRHSRAAHELAVDIHLGAGKYLQAHKVPLVVGRHELVGDDAVLGQYVEAAQRHVLLSVAANTGSAHVQGIHQSFIE